MTAFLLSNSKKTIMAKANHRDLLTEINTIRSLGEKDYGQPISHELAIKIMYNYRLEKINENLERIANILEKDNGTTN